MTDQRHTIFFVAALVAAVDQFTKIVAVSAWTDAGASLGAIEFTLVRNSGGAFGLATGSTLLWTSATAALVVLATVAVARGRLDTRRLGTWSTIAVGAMLGGGIGNLIDRIVRAPGPARGAVVDWIAIDPYPRVFNLADVALRIGAVIIILGLIAPSATARRTLHPTNGAGE
jgi:signal peptidase II